MYGFIRGFQRWVWWPKWAPASSNCCMVTTGAAIGISPSGYTSVGTCDPGSSPGHRYGGSACGMPRALNEEPSLFKRLGSRRHEKNECGTILLDVGRTNR